MPDDIQHFNLRHQVSEIEHRYGPGVHILSDPYLSSLLAILSSQGVVQPTVNYMVETCYSHLLRTVISHEFPRKTATINSRMIEYNTEGRFKQEIIDPETGVVCVDLARAGILPTQVCFNTMNYFLNPENVRQDHIMAQRVATDTGTSGTSLTASKVGGGIDNSIVLMADPMGATGGTLCEILTYYKEKVHGTAQKYIALHLIITPEYLRSVRAVHPDLVIYALRLDRGLSGADVLRTVPGTHFDRERGLNENHYIVPGAGGLGEVMNNAFV
jgi:uracil phosphoribosyltransferase